MSSEVKKELVMSFKHCHSAGRYEHKNNTSP